MLLLEGLRNKKNVCHLFMLSNILVEENAMDSLGEEKRDKGTEGSDKAERREVESGANKTGNR